MHVFLTGATGFIGNALLPLLLCKHKVTAAARHEVSAAEGLRCYPIADIDSATDWTPALRGMDVVVHAAARAHVMRDSHANPLAVYRKVNVDGTLNLASQAAAAGVRRFIFISSIKVNGEQTLPGRPFRATDTPAPEDAYGISKWEAEQALMQVAAETGMEIVIIRPPLVYGPGVKGNLASMIRLLEKGIPLPLGAIHNQRSLVGLDNLVDLITRCLDHPAAANQMFLAGDGVDLSTSELLRALADAMGRPARLLPVPASLLCLGASLLGKRAVAQRVLGSLQVDITHTRETLDWTPPCSVSQGLRHCFTRSP